MKAQLPKELCEMNTQRTKELCEMKAQDRKSVKAVSCLLAMIVAAGILVATEGAKAATVSIPVGDLAGIDSALANNNYGGINAMFIGDANDPGVTEAGRLLIDFDLSAIPAGSTIDSATLRLAFFGFRPPDVTTISVRYAAENQTADWTTGATWNTYDGVNAWTTAGGGIMGGVLSSVTSGFVGSNTSRVDFNFTGLAGAVQGWLDDPSSNRGFLIRNNNEIDTPLEKYMYGNWQTTDNISFGGGFTAFPILDVDYTVIPEPASFGLVLLGSVLITGRGFRRKTATCASV